MPVGAKETRERFPGHAQGRAGLGAGRRLFGREAAVVVMIDRLAYEIGATRREAERTLGLVSPANQEPRDEGPERS